MAAETKIQWADHTWSPWIGCTKWSEGCRNCYAAARDNRWGGDHWGPGKPRQVTSVAYWKHPLEWNAAAAARGVRESVFPSLCDPFDAEAPDGGRDWLWALIWATPQLDWLLLTKRPELVELPWGDRPWPNVWIIASVENQETADLRIPALLSLRVAHRGLSCEPLLEQVDLGRHLACPTCKGSGLVHEEHDLGASEVLGCQDCMGETPLHWVIVGGESGAGARPMRIAWARSIVKQCTDVGVPVFVKQLGGCPVFKKMVRVERRGTIDAEEQLVRLRLRDPKGGDPAEWPADLRVRQFPAPPNPKELRT